MGKLSGLDLASQTEGKSRRAVQNFPQGTVIVEKGPHPHFGQVGRWGLSARCWWSPIKQLRGMGDTWRGMITRILRVQFPQVSLYERVVVATLSPFSHCWGLEQGRLMWFHRRPLAKEIPKWMKKWVTIQTKMVRKWNVFMIVWMKGGEKWMSKKIDYDERCCLRSWG